MARAVGELESRRERSLGILLDRWDQIHAVDKKIFSILNETGQLDAAELLLVDKLNALRDFTRKTHDSVSG